MNRQEIASDASGVGRRDAQGHATMATVFVVV